MQRDSGTPPFIPRRVDGEEPTSRAYGIEIELDNHDAGADYAEALADIESEDWHAKADGSLTDNGIECVSQPASLLWWQSKNWTDDALPLNLSREWRPLARCGMHVHAQCPIGILPIVWRVWNSCPQHDADFIQYAALAKRTALDVMRQYASPGLSKPAPTGVGQSQNTKYRACRLTPEGIEVRIFGSTRDPNTIVTNITLVALSIRFAKQIHGFRQQLQEAGEESPNIDQQVERYYALAAFREYVKGLAEGSYDAEQQDARFWIGEAYSRLASATNASHRAEAAVA